MPGPPPKPAHLRQGHRSRPGNAKVLDLMPRLEAAPACPTGWLKVTRQLWDRWWVLVVAQTWDDGDAIVLERLGGICDEYFRAFRAVRKHGRLVLGSKNQPVLHPLIGYLKELRVEIRHLEVQLCIPVKARLALGITVGKAARTIEDLSQDLEIDWDDDGYEQPVSPMGDKTRKAPARRST